MKTMLEKEYVITIQDPMLGTLVMPFNEGLQIESGGNKIFGRVLHPAFHDLKSIGPVVLMLHGHPGGDKNMDLAEWFRRNGFTVVVFSYRGVWGSHGNYCLSHNIEDTAAVAEFIRVHAEDWRVDPDRLFLFGHSMGGFAALNAMACGLKVKGAILMAPCDMGYNYLYDRTAFDDLMKSKEKGYFTLPTEDYMERDAAAYGEHWYFLNLLPKLDSDIPYRFIGGMKDTTTPPEKHVLPLVKAMAQKGYNVKYTELPDGHMFPVTRARLAVETLRCLQEMDT